MSECGEEGYYAPKARAFQVGRFRGASGGDQNSDQQGDQGTARSLACLTGQGMRIHSRMKVRSDLAIASGSVASVWPRSEEKQWSSSWLNLGSGRIEMDGNPIHPGAVAACPTGSRMSLTGPSLLMLEASGMA